MQGDFTRYTFDITGRLRHGTNALALKVYPNDPNRMFTLDNVDWTQIPPDNNTGIQFPIQLHTSGPLALSDAHVVQHDAPNFSRATLLVKGVVSNESGRTQSGLVAVSVHSGRGARARAVDSACPPCQPHRHLQAGDSPPARMVALPDGLPASYRMTMSVSQHGQPADTESETFGIRTVTSRLVGPSPMAPHGSRQFLVNGRPFIFRGGGWSEDLFLRYSASYTADRSRRSRTWGSTASAPRASRCPRTSTSGWTARGS